MTNATPKTLEYSTIKRQRKRYGSIIVLVLASLAAAWIGSEFVKQFSVTYSRYSYELNRQRAIDRDIDSIRKRAILFDEQDNVRLPVFNTSPRWPFDQYMSSGWLDLRNASKINQFRRQPYELTTACLARLNAGKGMRNLGIDLAISFDLKPGPVLAKIHVISVPTLFHRAEIVHESYHRLVTFEKTLSVLPGTATGTDRATFKIIADGQEKTFVVILKKDDTIEFAELTP